MLLSLWMFACAPSAPEPPDEATLQSWEETGYAARTLLVGTRGGRPALSLDGRSLRLLRTWDALGVVEVELPSDAEPLSALPRVLAQPRVRWVEPDLRRQTLTDDPFRSTQWHMDLIGVDAAWAAGGWGGGAVVAVLDTGLSLGGKDTPAHLLPGWDFVEDDDTPLDGHGHGTHVAGTVAQATDNGRGVVGVSPGASLLVGRVLDSQGYGSTSDIVDAITWAADQGADVVNMSFGSSSASSAEEAALVYAAGKGVTLVAAAGNSGRRGLGYPARYEVVIAVGAVSVGDRLAPYSSRGAGLELMAPGGDTRRDDNGDGYVDGVLQETFGSGGWGYYFKQGTSMAAPHVAGLAALLSSHGATRDDIRAVMRETAVDLGPAGWDSDFGYGRIDAPAALASWLGSAPGGDTGDPGGDTGDPGGDTGDPGGDTGDPEADPTPPQITDVSHTKQGPNLRVRFRTDEPATGEVCDNQGTCAASPLGTTHDVILKKPRGSSYVITATDESGNAGSSGPHAF